MRGAWGDFVRLCPGEGVGGDRLQPALVPRRRGVRAAGRGRQRSPRRRVPRSAPVGKRRQEVSCMGGTAPPFSSVPGKFISSALLQARLVALLTRAPTPSLPGRRLAAQGTVGAPAPSRPAVGLSSPGAEEKFRSCGGGRVRRERSCARGRGALGWQAGGRVERCAPGGLYCGGRRSGGVSVQGGLRVTWELRTWGGGTLNPRAQGGNRHLVEDREKSDL